ncbi:ATP-dependent DNA helicase UvrD2 [Angustibacter sp. Root456]|uniref:ATP-dependent DNA helicase UvrD2 n=1 Tax=Angustibacter sp. Root456 TaxID=1736539 RepID=UPI0006F4D46C|nr:ATP-dependent DNA helicase UvrD2 [Angustibacter sp. Root456]KQX69838.1 ATP-dependent DNA helicase [Angustibacter sp. Root456]
MTQPTALRASADAVLDALDPEQREVATSLAGPLCVLAGAGTGKTRAITHRIAYGVHAGVMTPQQVLAVTFTARAAGEMRSRLRDLGVAGVQARTFHAAALRQLHYFWPQVIGGAAPEVMPHKAGLVAEAGSRLRLQLDRTAVRDLAAEVEWAKVSLLTPETYAAAARRAGRDPAGLDATAMARVLALYEEVKGERGVIDFEDVLLVTAGVLQDHPQVAEAVRRQYRHFVVDEYQDVSPLQQRLLDLWLGGRQDVCVVGDASQTIYSFTGASPKYLLDFPRRHEGAKVVRLVRDYRSTPQVVRLANLLLDRVPVAQRRARVELVAQRAAGPEPTFTGYDDDVAEAAGIARRIGDLVAQGTRPSEVAVLFRTNAQSQSLEQALAEAGIAYVLRGGERFFSRREVREAVMLLRGAARAGDAETPLGEAARDVLVSGGWSAQPPSQSGAVRERWESLQALAGLADEVAAKRPGATLADLVAELDERSAAQHAPTVEGVTLASLHSAKGLEWDAVFLAGVSEGLMPISMADGPEAVEEERRLLYVGITRTREHLHVSWARARTPGGRASRQPSRFLDGLRPADDASSGGGVASSGRGGSSRGKRSRTPAKCRTCGAPLMTGSERKVGRCDDCPATYDETTFEALRTWRSAVATAASVPAYVVFTDATLVALAENQPDDVSGLAQIPGIGATKRERYGEQVLAVLAGADPTTVAASTGADASDAP